MATAPEIPLERMNADAFLQWVEANDYGDQRYELIGGFINAMASGRLMHSRAKLRTTNALQSAADDRNLRCEAIMDGVGVKASDDEVFIPDASLYCGEDLAGDIRIVPEPVVVVEVVSPSTRAFDLGHKRAAYLAVPSIRHYLVVEPDQRVVVHHRKGEDGNIAIHLLRDGTLDLDPPGLTVAVADLLPREG